MDTLVLLGTISAGLEWSFEIFFKGLFKGLRVSPNLRVTLVRSFIFLVAMLIVVTFDLNWVETFLFQELGVQERHVIVGGFDIISFLTLVLTSAGLAKGSSFIHDLSDKIHNSKGQNFDSLSRAISDTTDTDRILRELDAVKDPDSFTVPTLKVD